MRKSEKIQVKIIKKQIKKYKHDPKEIINPIDSHLQIP